MNRQDTLSIQAEIPEMRMKLGSYSPDTVSAIISCYERLVTMSRIPLVKLKNIYYGSLPDIHKERLDSCVCEICTYIRSLDVLLTELQ